MSGGTTLATGWRPDLEQEAKARWAAEATVPLYGVRVFAGDDRPLPAAFSLARCVLWWHNQGPVGSCFANAAVGAVQTAEAAALLSGQDVPLANLSRWFAWYESRKLDGLLGNGDGGTISSTMRVLHQLGVCREFLAPYKAQRQYLDRKPSAEAYDDATTYQLAGLIELDPQDAEARKRAIYNGFPVVLGIWWPEGWDRGKIDQQGRTTGVGPGGFGHALYDVGWTEWDGRLYWHRVNSHGPIYPLPPEEIRVGISGYASSRNDRCHAFWVREDHDLAVIAKGYAEYVAPGGFGGFQSQRVYSWGEAAG